MSAYTHGNYRGAVVGISLIGFDGDIEVIHQALDKAEVDFDAQDATESQVYVAPLFVGTAVKVINDLGYETDEDEDVE